MTTNNASLLQRRTDAVPRGVGTALPVFAARARNAELWDVEGRRYIDFAAGIVLKEKTGAKVEQGQTLAVLHTNRPETIADAERVFLEAIRWGTDAPEAQPLIYGIVK